MNILRQWLPVTSSEVISNPAPCTSNPSYQNSSILTLLSPMEAYWCQSVSFPIILALSLHFPWFEQENSWGDVPLPTVPAKPCRRSTRDRKAKSRQPRGRIKSSTKVKISPDLCSEPRSTAWARGNWASAERHQPPCPNSLTCPPQLWEGSKASISATWGGRLLHTHAVKVSSWIPDPKKG